MTTDMAFECLLISRDPSVVSAMTKLLADFAICTTVCPTATRAFEHLSNESPDLVIVDLQRDSPELLRYMDQTRRLQRPPVITISDIPDPIPGGYPLLLKPITTQSGSQLLKHVYSGLLQEYRQHARFALMKPLVAKNQYGRSLQVTVTNIGKGGVGLNTQEFLSRGDLLSFSMLLPGEYAPIDVEARVLWVRQYGAAGCEFASIPEDDLCRLHAWLEQRSEIKGPVTERDNTVN